MTNGAFSSKIDKMPSRSKPDSGFPKIPKVDRRLIGTWKSDARRTIAEWTWRKKPSRQNLKALEFIFGKLQVTFDRSREISRLPDRKWKQSQRYKVLGVDGGSVAIILYGGLEIKDRKRYPLDGLRKLEKLYPDAQIKQIHFGENSFWVSLGDGKNREFFKRIRRTK